MGPSPGFSKEEKLSVGHITAISNYGFVVGVFYLRDVLSKLTWTEEGKKEMRFKNNLSGNDRVEGLKQRHS